MAEITPVQHPQPLPRIEKVKREEKKPRRDQDKPEQDKEGDKPLPDPHIDEYA